MNNVKPIGVSNPKDVKIIPIGVSNPKDVSVSNFLVTNIEHANREFIPIVANFTGPVRMDKMAGRDHLVIPMVMMVEGVLNGSKGPVLYTEDEMSKFPSAWNSKPVVVYHPQMNGRGISACDPDVISNRGIGVIMNTRFEDGALKAEAWCEVDRMEAIDNRIADAVENGEMMELSTGLFIEADKTPGDHDGVHYDMIARNFQPDHLAVLPDLKGACSIEDGAGFIRNQNESVIISGLSEEHRVYAEKNSARIHQHLELMIKNEMSHSDIRSLLGSSLRAETNNDNLWIDEVFDKFFIYEDDGKLFMRGYTIVAGKVELTGASSEVVRVIEFKTLDGKIVGNRKEDAMHKKQLVDALIANKSTTWAESDRDALMAMNEEILVKMDPVKNDGEDKDEAKAKADADELAANEATAKTKADKLAADKLAENSGEETTEDWLSKLPKEARTAVENSMKLEKAIKDDLIGKLVTNKACTFKKEFLETKDVEELQNLLTLAGGDATPVVPSRFDYSGQGPVLLGNEADAGEPLIPESVAC